MCQSCDVIVIGAGMAGASLAYELSDKRKVILLEREEQPGYHSTGRSAAAFIPSYGNENPVLRALTMGSLGFLQNPKSGSWCAELLRRRGLLTLCGSVDNANAEQEQAFGQLQQMIPSLVRTDAEAIRALLPLVSDEYASDGWFEPDVFDIDVDALHQGYLRGLLERGGKLYNRAEVLSVQREAGQWHVRTPQLECRAPIIVNAAGAWADVIAELAGVAAIGLRPLRRTAVLLDPPQGCDVSGWPLVMARDGSFYLKPDAGLILASPADEHLSPPCDAQPEELDIAYAVHFAQQALQLEVRKVKHSWAGLRSFAPDRSPVIGYDSVAEGFFWLAGQGGHGIQTAPAAARLGAGLLLEGIVPDDLLALGLDSELVSPARFNEKLAVRCAGDGMVL